MVSEDDGYILDADGNRILIGLTLDETREFERLDELILNLSSAVTDDKRSRNERRWLMLHDRHEAAVRIHLSTENAKALNVLRTERASVIVRIVDRGPYVRDRILDLSLGAARNLGITERGVVQVRIEVL
jgi:hypothetical protein